MQELNVLNTKFSTYSLSKLNFFFPFETVSKLKSMASSSVTDIDFQELRKSFPISLSVLKGRWDFVT